MEKDEEKREKVCEEKKNVKKRLIKMIEKSWIKKFGKVRENKRKHEKIRGKREKVYEERKKYEEKNNRKAQEKRWIMKEVNKAREKRRNKETRPISIGGRGRERERRRQRGGREGKSTRGKQK